MTDDATMKFGLLMESAQTHQRLAEVQLEKLRMHTQNLDGVVRDEIRRTLIEELQLLLSESRRCAEALRRIGRGAGLRGALWCVAMSLLGTVTPIAVMHWMLPSEADLLALRARRDQLSANVAALETAGGRLDWRHCGEDLRLCIRVDRKAPAYGAKADYYVVAAD